jgi:hypothetical protein
MPKIEKDTSTELNRIKRIMDFNDGIKPSVSKISSNALRSSLAEGIKGSRAPQSPNSVPWSSFEDRQLPLYLEDEKIINPEKSANKHAKNQDYIGSYYNWNGPLRPEYDMQESMAIYDTESYVKQAINRRLALTFRNGFEIVGRERDVKYINSRISTIEFVSNRSFESFMKKILFCLLLQGNCFLLKIRKDKAASVTQKEGRKIPVSGYQIIPAHQIQPYLKKGVIWSWRRYYDTGRYFDEFEPSEIVHFKFDHKPWHIYGTPRTVAVREDIFGLRRLEENTELLFINYLFPLFHVKVGTELNPTTYTDEGTSELDLVKFQIENMPKEGVFVTDERTTVDIVGANGQVLDFMSLIKYYRERVFAGLGMSELDMGSSTHGGSAASDNISQNLKDSIKADIEEFADQVKFYFFKEWFAEANYSLGTQAALDEIALSFHEIDLDNRIKEENHVMNMYNNQCLTFAEMRKRINLKPTADQMDLQINRDQAWIAEVQSKLDTNSQIKILKAQKDLGIEGHTTTTHKTTNGKTKKSTSVTKKVPPPSKLVQNLVTPINQHGQKTSTQKVGHDAFIEILTEKLVTAYELTDEFTDSEWSKQSAQLIDESLDEFQTRQLDDSEENSYTKHLQEDINKLKDLFASVTGLEELELLLDHVLDNEEEIEILEGNPDEDIRLE